MEAALKKLVAVFATSAMAFSAHANTKYVECRQSDGKNDVQLIFATIDDNSDKAEVKLYATTADCAKNGTCGTDVYAKETLPTILRLTYVVSGGSLTLQHVIDINRADLSVVTRTTFAGTETTHAGKCEIKKIDASRKQL
jgi:hypothetical protein